MRAEVDLKQLLDQLIRDWESEVVEFKRAKTDNEVNTHEFGKYFSALSNEANLKNVESGWLVFGVDNKSRTVVGSEFRSESERLHATKKQIANDTQPRVSFRGIYEINLPEGRVILFEIPAAPQGIPIAWKGHLYGREGESLTNLSITKQDEIRNQTVLTDWTAQIVEGATLADIDPDALVKAKQNFALKHKNRFNADEVSAWSDETFLDRAKVTVNGGITRAALLLLGKREATHLLSPHPAQLTWKLEGEERAYEHFSPPFLLNTSVIYNKIRNIQIRILPEYELVPVEVAKYDQEVVLEGMHNCIAHQDYRRNGRVIVTEKPDRLIFENEGEFFEGQPEDYQTGETTPRRYRNPFLTQAMVELNMIDTMGYGIFRMIKAQVKRYLPLPDFDLTTGNVVKTTIYGSVIDPGYAIQLLSKTDLPLNRILALDRVQKKQRIDDATLRQLKRDGLVEGRRPNLIISAAMAAASNQEPDYIKSKGFDDEHYRDLIIEYLNKFEKANRKKIDELLWDKLPGILDDEKKENKIRNLLTSLRKEEKIKSIGAPRKKLWVLFDYSENP